MLNFKFQIPNFKFQKGQLLVELLIAIGLSAIILPALLTGFVSSREGKVQEAKRVGAVALLRETVDATRSVKNKTDNWVNFAVNGTYHHVLSGSAWSLVAGSETVGDFTRQIVISDVNRDSSGNIVTSGGTVDPSTKKVVITISWVQPHSSSVSSTLYLSRYSTEVFIDTTVSDFDAGVHTGTTVTNNSGGEVTLGGGGTGSWCQPDLTITALDLPKSGVANAVTAIEGRAFAGTGDNASGVSFANISIANSTPPSAEVVGTFDGYKTNGVFGESGYAYLATDNNFKEIVIIDLNQVVNGKYVEVGVFNAPGNGNGNSIWVSGNTGYMTTGSKLYNINLSNKASPSAIDTDGVTLAGTGNKIYVVGSYVYVATSSASKQLQIIDASNPSNLTVVGNLSSGLNDQGAKDVFVNDQGTRAYVVTSASSSGREFFIINTSTKNAPTAVSGGSYEANGMNPKGVTVVTDNKAIIVGTGAEEYQVIDIANESSPSRCGGLPDINTGVNGVSSVVEQDGDAYSYIITGDASSEFKIIEGGPGGGFSTTGDFESRTFNAGIQVGFNYFSFTINEPSGSDLKFQVAINNDNATWNYVGPDGTGSTFFETAGPVPLSQISGTYIRYKAYFTGSQTSAPVLYDATINYSF